MQNKAFATAAPGVWPVAFTPFGKDGGVDLGVVREQVGFYGDTDCAGVFVVAQSGEMEMLTQDERLAVARAALDAAPRGMGIAASGNFGATLEEQIETTRQMGWTGVDSVVLSVSTLPVDAEDSAHYTDAMLRIAEAVDCPLGLYECPSPIHRLISPADTRRLGESGRFNFMKETSRRLDIHSEKVAAAQGTPLGIFQANLQVLLEPWPAGLAGFSGIIANIFPEILVAFFELESIGKAAPLKAAIGPRLVDFQLKMLAGPYPASGKYLLAKRGMPIAAASRRPALLELGAAERAALDALDGEIEWLLSHIQ